MKKITIGQNTDKLVKCDFCEELFKEKDMLVFCDWEGNLGCCEDDNCRHEFSKIIKNYGVNYENRKI